MGEPKSQRDPSFAPSAPAEVKRPGYMFAAAVLLPPLLLASTGAPASSFTLTFTSFPDGKRDGEAWLF